MEFKADMYGSRDVTYNSLDNEAAPPLGNLLDSSAINPDIDPEDAPNIKIIHWVPQNKGGWTHIEDLDSFFTRMYRYYLKGGFYPMLLSEIFQLLQFAFVVWFFTFLVHCINYPLLFREDPLRRTDKISIHDVIYGNSVCVNRIKWQWWCLLVLCGVIWAMKFIKSLYHLYYAYDTKMFYNKALRIKDCDIAYINWCTVQSRVREAQSEQHMCVHKPDIDELDIYHRILRFNNYLIAMVNKNLLPLNVNVPFLGSFYYLSKGLKYNLELLLFYGPWSPWENCWQLRECYKDSSKRMELSWQLEKHFTYLALLNLCLMPLIQAWQILYFFFSYAELIKRSPASLGMRTWSLYARVSLRHFNELDHELQDRLNRAHKPATKYVASFASPVVTVIAKNVAFLSASILGVLVALSVYDEDVLTVEHVLSIITVLGCIVAGARSLIGWDEGQRYIQGATISEELLVQVLGHIHYLPAKWKGRANTKEVALNFQELFQYRAVYLLFELLSPILCPFILLSLRSRALDIVDFYRNFTVSIRGIGDVCSFAQLDVRRHGNPEWQATPLGAERVTQATQYEQGEGGKTELSLLAFSCRNPNWKQPMQEQRQFLKSVRHSMRIAANPLNSTRHTMLGSFIQQSMLHGNNSLIPSALCLYQRNPNRLPNMDETFQEEDEDTDQFRHFGVGDASPGGEPDLMEENKNLSIAALHLYDMHLSQQSHAQLQCSTDNCSHVFDERNVRSMQGGRGTTSYASTSKESTPLLKKS